MSKDPAILFYTSDFLTGTLLMTDDQIGKYIKLLCLQHQKGYLTEKDMLNICKSYDEDIFIKFEKNGEGKYYNIRMKGEIDKRKAYSESRRQNRLTKKDMINISKSYVVHMENENEDIIEIEIEIEDFKSLMQFSRKIFPTINFNKDKYKFEIPPFPTSVTKERERHQKKWKQTIIDLNEILNSL